MMACSLEDPLMNWMEVERLADLSDFKVLRELRLLKTEVENG